MRCITKQKVSKNTERNLTEDRERSEKTEEREWETGEEKFWKLRKKNDTETERERERERERKREIIEDAETETGGLKESRVKADLSRRGNNYLLRAKDAFKVIVTGTTDSSSNKFACFARCIAYAKRLRG